MARIYVIAMVCAAAALLFAFGAVSPLALDSEEILAFTLLAGTCAIAYHYAFRVEDGGLSTSLAFILLLTAILIFPVPIAVYCAVCGLAVFELSRKASSPLVAWFNLAQGAVTTALAGGAYRGVLGLFEDRLVVQLFALLLSAAVLGVVNQAFSAVFLALRTGRPVTRTLVSVLGSVMLVDDLLVSPLALFAALFYRDVGFFGLVAILLPLLLVRHAYDAKLKAQRGMEDLLRVLVKTLETRDRYTSGHSVRVSVLARSIAEDLRMRPKQVKQVEMAALVHDIGKIEEVYAEIIMKPHSLSDVEKLVIRTHATRGADFLKGLSSFPEDVIQGVRHHHARYDGAGYPDGMHGETIPLVSRIIMICDSVDAMLSDRPYRKALSIDVVRAELQRCAGAQFDPKLVEVMLAKGTLERAVALLGDAYKPVEPEEGHVIEAAHRFKDGTVHA